jgi:hypothetical protein
VPFEEKAAPPPALPDGSIPTYGGHGLPGSTNGEPPLSPFGWGPSLNYFDNKRVRARAPVGSVLPFVALLVLYGGIVSALLTALAVRA